MAIVIGVTGGIGSGKSTVLKEFKKLGFKVYQADEAGRIALNKPEVIQKIVSLFGQDILHNDLIDRKKLSAIVFSDKEKLNQLNNIIHPEVKMDFEFVLKNLKENEIILKESAILFENQLHLSCRATILITAPKEIRIQRVLSRDKVSREEVEKRMQNQWSDKAKEKLATFSVKNLNLEQTIREILIFLKQYYDN